MAEETHSSSSKEVPLLTYISRGGGTIFLRARHQYTSKEKCKNGTMAWECNKRKKNKFGGKITLKGNNIITEKRHDCTPDFAQNEIDEGFYKCKNKVASPEFPPIAAVYKDTIAAFKNKGIDLLMKIPEIGSVKSTLYRTRNNSVGLEKIVCKDVGEVKVSEKFSDFLLADYSFDGKRILVFASQKGRRIMSEGTDFLADGTFKSCPVPFKQLYTIHCDIGSTTQSTNIVPVAYALMSDKGTQIYKILFELIKSQVLEWTPITFKTDFEMAVMKAILSVFPAVTRKGCYFHFSRAVWKKGKYLGLTKFKRTRRQVALCAVLPFLPSNEIFNGWWYIAAKSPDDANSKQFRQYMLTQWLREKFIPVWSVFGERHRTTNLLEAWHSKLNKTIKRKQPNMIELLNGLFADASYYEVTTMQIENRPSSSSMRSRRSKESALQDEFIRETSRELLYGQITVGHFLEILR